MILCARSTSKSCEQSTRRRSHSENMRKGCSFYSQNNKIVWLPNMEDTSLEKSTWCAKVCGLFSWLCFPGADWLGRQTAITWLDQLLLAYLWGDMGAFLWMNPETDLRSAILGFVASKRTSNPRKTSVYCGNDKNVTVTPMYIQHGGFSSVLGRHWESDIRGSLWKFDVRKNAWVVHGTNSVF